ncbi:hypothetical protein DQ244_14900 [Blastococcus sp. TBT05-19]|uniref:hypothetical protein n=1 Tax=Blastococcus sp. TBT05-19 TaxID=2250581 RepID=UPI000DEAC25C|nr:hypothetical protein [Blastococcus sp. TBT05-19]RBY89051.1 hypothetical protein DQ244_14900 [Blastococcus sp. TBT05-19]
MEEIPLGSSYTWSQARAAGVTRRQIAEDGVRLSRGLYISSAVESSLPLRCAAWARVLPPDAVFGLGTAAALYGLRGEPSETHVVLTPRRVLPQRAGLVAHSRALQTEDRVDLGGVPVTSGAQTFLDMAGLLHPADLLVLGDGLMRTGRLRADDLIRRLARADRVRGVARAREWAPRLTEHAGSPRESLVRYWLLTSDLPEPEVQVPLWDRRGREVAHADLGYPRWKVALEYEGRQHADIEQFGRDVDRYSLMAADGWLVLRFAARHGRRAVVERTRRALLSRGWREPRG